MKNGIMEFSERGGVSEFPEVGSLTVIFVFPRALGSWNRIQQADHRIGRCDRIQLEAGAVVFKKRNKV